MEIAAVFGLNWKLLLIQGINFGIVLFILQRFLYKPLIKMIDERRRVVEKGVRDAEDAKVQLAKAQERCSVIMGEASAKSKSIIDRTETLAKEREIELLKDAERKARRKEEEARLEAEETKKRTIEESQDEIARLAILAAEKVLRQEK